MKVAVVGGGIAGLAAAWELRHDAEVTVFEPAPLGGKIRTTDFAGRPVDEGPDAFITRTPAAVDLCQELGIAGELVAPAAGRTLLWQQGRLRPLPDGLVLGVPRQLGPMLRSGLLSPLGIARAALDLVLPATPPGDDESVRTLVGRRFGDEVATRLVEPLLGSIHAAPIDDLSAAATAPQLLAAARRSRSLLLALRAQAPGSGSGGPLFLSPSAGVGRLVDVLASSLAGCGVGFVAEEVRCVRPLPGSQVEVRTGGQAARFHGVVLATPAPAAAGLLGEAAPPDLATLELTSVTLVTLEYAASDLDVPPGINGVLVPPAEGRLMTACSFGSSKWPQWAAPGRVVVRVSTGRHGDDRAARSGDDDLVERLAAELRAALGTPADPRRWRVSRWPGAFPFYRVGHPRRVAGIVSALGRTAPGVALAGASYSGAGIPACIASGRGAGRAVVADAARAALG